MKSSPILPDIDLTRYQYHAGDRLIVRVGLDLSPEHQKRIYKTVSQFAGEDMRVIIVNCLKQRFVLIRGEEKTILVDQAQGYRIPQLKTGQMEVVCSVVNFQRDDKLVVYLQEFTQGLYRKRIEEWLKNWAGDDVEIQLVSGLIL